jgi:hypothetical protein
MSSTNALVDYYFFNAFISPDIVSPGEETNPKLREYLNGNEMKDLEMAYNTTETNSVEIIYKHEGDRGKNLGIAYALDYVPKVGLNAYIVMRHDKRDDLSRTLHAKIKSTTMSEVSIRMDIGFGPDNVRKRLIVVDHIALVNTSYFAYAQNTTGGGSLIKLTPIATFPAGKRYSMAIPKGRLGDFLNSKKTVGHLLIERSFGTNAVIAKRPLTIQRAIMSSPDAADTAPAETVDAMDTEPTTNITGSSDPAAAAKTSADVSEQIVKLDADIKVADASITAAEEKLKSMEKTADNKANEQELLAGIQTLKTSKATMEANRDQLINSSGLAAATVDRIMKDSKESSIDFASIKAAVDAEMEAMKQDLTEAERKQIDHDVATNSAVRNSLTSVVASYVSRKRKATDAPAHEDTPPAKRTKIEEQLDALTQKMESFERSFTQAAAVKSNGMADFLMSLNRAADQAKKSASESETVVRQFGGSGSGSSATNKKSNTTPAPQASQPSGGKPGRRVVSEAQIADKIAGHNRLNKLMAKSTNSTPAH